MNICSFFCIFAPENYKCAIEMRIAKTHHPLVLRIYCSYLHQ